MRFLLQAVTIASAIVATQTLAEGWTLVPQGSHLAYGTVKSDVVGEVNSFTSLSGRVGPDGQADITIDLSSVETNIDIRNARMIEHVFRNVGTAKLTAAFDMSTISDLKIGGFALIDAEAVLSLVGVDVEFDAEMFVARLSETSVLVTTNDMVFISTEDAGVDAGVDTLMELAGLPGITRTVPVTARLIFEKDGTQAQVAPAAPVAQETAALDGDISAGKKVFRKCQACHQLKPGRHGVGPSLHGIMGATAGAAEDYRYSGPMQQSGIVWTAATLTDFLSDPRGTIPGNRMQFKGLKKNKDIVNLIAFLTDQSQG
ncbi:MAG: cytochrome c family protein [Pseudomonadota bacterium]